MAGILKVDKYQDFNGNDIMTSDGSGNITINNAALKMTPAFEAHSDGSQSISDATATKVQFETEVYDTNSYYDNTTNYRFTPLVAGKYFVYTGVNGYAGGSADLIGTEVFIYKNGSLYRQSYHNMTGNPGFILGTPVSAVIDMNGSTDYVEIYGAVDGSSAGSESFFSANNYFGAYKIIGA